MYFYRVTVPAQLQKPVSMMMAIAHLSNHVELNLNLFVNATCHAQLIQISILSIYIKIPLYEY